MHLLLYNYKEVYDKYIYQLIPYVNLNYQDNTGNTILHILIKQNIWNKYIKFLNIKKMNIFIKNNDGKTALDLVSANDMNQFLNVTTNSYYNYLKNIIKDG
nr:ankyrin repeat domain containing protein [Mimivirus sp.]